MAGGRHLAKHKHILGHHPLEFLPAPHGALVVLGVAVRVFIGQRCVDELPGDEAGALGPQRDGLEELDLIRIVVEHGVGKHHVMTDGVTLMVAGGRQFVEQVGTRHKHHGVGAAEVKCRIASRLGERGRRVVQLRGVVHLVEAVHHNLVIEVEVHHHFFVQDHVLHPEPAQVLHDVGPDPVLQRGGGVGTGQIYPHPSTPLLHGHRGRAQPGQDVGVEILTLRHPHHLAGLVVYPAVPRAGESPITA